MIEALSLVGLLLGFGDLPAAMGWTGEVVLGPAPYVFVPIGPVGISFGGEAMPTFRIRALPGPTHLWVDIPPPALRLGIGRSLGPALVALILEPSGGTLSWEIPLTPRASAFGALGREAFLGGRWRLRGAWIGGLIGGGALWLWLGFYF